MAKANGTKTKIILTLAAIIIGGAGAKSGSLWTEGAVAADLKDHCKEPVHAAYDVVMVHIGVMQKDIAEIKGDVKALLEHKGE